jgi:hypothetical protein
VQRLLHCVCSNVAHVRLVKLLSGDCCMVVHVC